MTSRGKDCDWRRDAKVPRAKKSEPKSDVIFKLTGTEWRTKHDFCENETAMYFGEFLETKTVLPIHNSL